MKPTKYTYRTVATLIDFKEVDGKSFRSTPDGKRIPDDKEPNPWGIVDIEIDRENQTLRWIPKQKAA